MTQFTPNRFVQFTDNCTGKITEFSRVCSITLPSNPRPKVEISGDLRDWLRFGLEKSWIKTVKHHEEATHA